MPGRHRTFFVETLGCPKNQVDSEKIVGTLASMVGVGIAWSSILSVPYAILAGALPAGRIGVYMGIFNFFIVIPEIVASLGFGWVMSHLLGNNRLFAVIAGGVLLALAAVLMQRVEDRQGATTPAVEMAAVA